MCSQSYYMYRQGAMQSGSTSFQVMRRDAMMICTNQDRECVVTPPPMRFAQGKLSEGSVAMGKELLRCADPSLRGGVTVPALVVKLHDRVLKPARRVCVPMNTFYLSPRRTRTLQSIPGLRVRQASPLHGSL